MSVNFEKLCCDCEYEWVPDDHFLCSACRDKGQRDCEKYYFKRKEDPEVVDEMHNLICPWCGNDHLTLTVDESYGIYKVRCLRCQRFVYLNKDNPIREWAKYCLDIITDTLGTYPPNMVAALNEELEKADTIENISPVNLINIMRKYKYALEDGNMKVHANKVKDGVDMVNHPSHYETGKFECIEVMEEAISKDAVMAFCLCNAFKYLYRCSRKNGVEDIRKAQWYLNKYLELHDRDKEDGNEDN